MSWVSDDDDDDDDDGNMEHEEEDIPLDFLSDDPDDEDGIHPAQLGNTPSIDKQNPNEILISDADLSNKRRSDSVTNDFSPSILNKNQPTSNVGRRHSRESISSAPNASNIRREAADSTRRNSSASQKPIAVSGCFDSRRNSNFSGTSHGNTNSMLIPKRRSTDSSGSVSLDKPIRRTSETSTTSNNPTTSRRARSTSIESHTSNSSRRLSNASITDNSRDEKKRIEEVGMLEEDSGLPDHLKVIAPLVSMLIGPNRRMNQVSTRHDAAKYEKYHRTIDVALEKAFSSRVKRTKTEVSQLGSFEIMLTLKGIEYTVFSKLHEKRFPNPGNVVARIRNLLGWDLRNIQPKSWPSSRVYGAQDLTNYTSGDRAYLEPKARTFSSASVEKAANSIDTRLRNVTFRCVFLSAYNGLPVSIPLSTNAFKGVNNFLIRNTLNSRGIACALEQDKETNMTFITCTLPLYTAVQVEMLPNLAPWLRQVKPSATEYIYVDDRGPAILPIYVARPKVLRIEIRNSLRLVEPNVHVGVTSMLALEKFQGVEQTMELTDKLGRICVTTLMGAAVRVSIEEADNENAFDELTCTFSVGKSEIRGDEHVSNFKLEKDNNNNNNNNNTNIIDSPTSESQLELSKQLEPQSVEEAADKLLAWMAADDDDDDKYENTNSDFSRKYSKNGSKNSSKTRNNAIENNSVEIPLHINVIISGLRPRHMWRTVMAPTIHDETRSTIHDLLSPSHTLYHKVRAEFCNEKDVNSRPVKTAMFTATQQERSPVTLAEQAMVHGALVEIQIPSAGPALKHARAKDGWRRARLIRRHAGSTLSCELLPTTPACSLPDVRRGDEQIIKGGDAGRIITIPRSLAKPAALPGLGWLWTQLETLVCSTHRLFYFPSGATAVTLLHNTVRKHDMFRATTSSSPVHVPAAGLLCKIQSSSLTQHDPLKEVFQVDAPGILLELNAGVQVAALPRTRIIVTHDPIEQDEHPARNVGGLPGSAVLAKVCPVATVLVLPCFGSHIDGTQGEVVVYVLLEEGAQARFENDLPRLHYRIRHCLEKALETSPDNGSISSEAVESAAKISEDESIHVNTYVTDKKKIKISGVNMSKWVDFSQNNEYRAAVRKAINPWAAAVRVLRYEEWHDRLAVPISKLRKCANLGQELPGELWGMLPAPPGVAPVLLKSDTQAVVHVEGYGATKEGHTDGSNDDTSWSDTIQANSTSFPAQRLMVHDHHDALLLHQVEAREEDLKAECDTAIAVAADQCKRLAVLAAEVEATRVAEADAASQADTQPPTTPTIESAGFFGFTSPNNEMSSASSPLNAIKQPGSPMSVGSDMYGSDEFDVDPDLINNSASPLDLDLPPRSPSKRLEAQLAVNKISLSNGNIGLENETEQQKERRMVRFNSQEQVRLFERSKQEVEHEASIARDMQEHEKAEEAAGFVIGVDEPVGFGGNSIFSADIGDLDSYLKLDEDKSDVDKGGINKDETGEYLYGSHVKMHVGNGGASESNGVGKKTHEDIMLLKASGNKEKNEEKQYLEEEYKSENSDSENEDDARRTTKKSRGGRTSRTTEIQKSEKKDRDSKEKSEVENESVSESTEKKEKTKKSKKSKKKKSKNKKQKQKSKRRSRSRSTNSSDEEDEDDADNDDNNTKGSTYRSRSRDMAGETVGYRSKYSKYRSDESDSESTMNNIDTHKNKNTSSNRQHQRNRDRSSSPSDHKKGSISLLGAPGLSSLGAAPTLLGGGNVSNGYIDSGNRGTESNLMGSPMGSPASRNSAFGGMGLSPMRSNSNSHSMHRDQRSSSPARSAYGGSGSKYGSNRPVGF